MDASQNPPASAQESPSRERKQIHLLSIPANASKRPPPCKADPGKERQKALSEVGGWPPSQEYSSPSIALVTITEPGQEKLPSSGTSQIFQSAQNHARNIY